MKRLIQITAIFFLIVTLTLPMQSFTSKPPAPSYTIVEITDLRESYYAMKVNMVGLSYENPLNTVYCINNIVYSPDTIELYNADKKFWYSSGCDAFQIDVYVKETSSSNWDWIGAIDTDSPYPTLTVANNFLQKFSVDFDYLANP